MRIPVGKTAYFRSTSGFAGFLAANPARAGRHKRICQERAGHSTVTLLTTKSSCAAP